jgi:Rrf2 family transcriptional regulator, nitric oxide-sensitive transcriptional repressor
MQLTYFTDYALRTLLYLGAHPDRTVPAAAVGEAYGISVDHVAKAAKWLTRHGYVSAQRGNSGGLRLACDPALLRLGKLVAELEPTLALVACFEASSNSCPLSPACKLKRALHEAQRAFIVALDQYTLADLLSNATELADLLATSTLVRPRARPRA